MIRFFVIAAWEFMRYLKSRGFLLATFLSPLIFTAFILIPSFYYENTRLTQDQVIGCVEIDTTSYSQLLAERLSTALAEDDMQPRILLEPILPDTSSRMRRDIINLIATRESLDSLDEAYNKVKERRKYHFQRPNSRTKTRLLSESYEEMISTREQRDLAEIDYNRMQTNLDSLVEKAVMNKADSLLRVKRISGYLLLDARTFERGIVEFHSLQPVNFLHIQPLKQALQVMVVEERMRQEEITVTKIQEMLQPLVIQQLLIEGANKREFKFLITYIAPVVAVLLLFVSIISNSGFLFTSIVSEKSSRILEILVSSVNTFQLIGGKMFGLGMLGLFQILIWMFTTFLLMAANIIPAEDIGFLTLNNAGLYVLYYFLGYLFFASIFVAVGSLSADYQDAHQLGLTVRIISIIPLALIVLVLLAPNSALIRFLSFIPVLTPTFMVLRTPLAQPPMIDYYISAGIMLLFIVLTALLGGKIFRIASIMYSQKASLRTLMDTLQNK